ncbi:YiiX/YebB-like N1pC/P60 family cysteine hydrolase [Cytobacillus horneckiae]|uniref:YiiX/YebB-like N1pC/P60 family cysteine hydrolase n=1 Tax=Cytobacillus horneckiae TaxID=549687 RepID=UPI003D1CE82C
MTKFPPSSGFIGAANKDYSNAVAFAKDQVGKPYSLAAAKDQKIKYYCSLLVWKSWNRQGFDLDGNGVLVVTPADLAKDSQTIVY